MTTLRAKVSLLPRLALAATLGCSLMLQGGFAVASAKKEEEKPAANASEYLDLKPAIITNFGGVGPVHFLKAEISLRIGKNPEHGLAVHHHLPQIRHAFVMLMARQTDETLSTMQGKEQIRQDALAAVQKIMQEEEGKPVVEDVLFNNLIIQR